ncbi:MAG: SOS response-associated peptidase [Gemmatimonadota bacterium]
MCGRFTLKTPVAEVARLFEADVPPEVDLPPRYNIAPTQPVVAVRLRGSSGERELALLRWGLLPAWVKDPAEWPTLINARAETLDRKPAFEDAVRGRRCLVPADGFYEWRRERGGKQPYYVRARDGSLLAFAGLWEERTDASGETLASCTIVTTDANSLLRPLHDRMPVMLDVGGQARWLDPKLRSYRELEPLLRPVAAERLVVHPVSRVVNRTEVDDPSCIEPLVPAPGRPADGDAGAEPEPAGESEPQQLDLL